MYIFNRTGFSGFFLMFLNCPANKLGFRRMRESWSKIDGYRLIVSKSVGPNQSVMACTRLDTCAYSRFPSNSFNPSVNPSSRAKCPPEESPKPQCFADQYCMLKRWLLKTYCCFYILQLSGKTASPLPLYCTLATVYPLCKFSKLRQKAYVSCFVQPQPHPCK